MIYRIVESLYCIPETIFFKFVALFREREQGRDREREKERIPSRLRTTSAEPKVGLEPTNHEIMT